VRCRAGAPVTYCSKKPGSRFCEAALRKGYALHRARDTTAGDDSKSYAGTAGIGSAVTDLIFSIAKREVTFFSDTAPISFL